MLKKWKNTTLANFLAFLKQEKTNHICISCSMQFEIISDCQLSGSSHVNLQFLKFLFLTMFYQIFCLFVSLGLAQINYWSERRNGGSAEILESS